MKKILKTVLMIVALSGMMLPATATAQQRRTVKGVVTDENDAPLPGATIVVTGSTRGVSTDDDGSYTIEVTSENVLEFSYIGYEKQTVKVGTQRTINVQLQPKGNELDEVTVVAFGQQKKESVISAIETVNVNELRVPSSNFTTAFAGRIAGMISYQTSGEPGHDNAEFFIRGVTTFGTGFYPLILIDNIEVSSSDLAKMHPDDIASFSILKDATATALYGARGANGVVLVTTKEGREGKVNVNVRVENSFSQPTAKIRLTDPITYMTLANEAVLTRDALAPTLYARNKIEDTRAGMNSYAFPAVDWHDMLVKSYTSNQRANINVSGGGNIARYYIAGSFSQDNGILKVDNRNNFNNNVSYQKYLLRMNMNINLTKTTELIARLHGAFDEYLGPISGGDALYEAMLKVSPVRFPAYYEPDALYMNAGHVLFGNQDAPGAYMNPYAEMLRGYKEESTSMMMAQLELKQKFDFITEGLNGRLLINTKRNAAFDLNRSYSPFYYTAAYDRLTNTYTLIELNSEGSGRGTDYLSYNQGGKTINSLLYGEAALNYVRSFGLVHNVSGMLVGVARNYLSANEETLQASLPQRNLGLSGRFTYNYDNRYFAEFNFGYNGSEKFDKGHRWGFFPSYGAGWVVSNEPFWDGSLKKLVSLLKFRLTYGLVGNDNIGNQRFFYLSEVVAGGVGGYVFGRDYDGFGSGKSGYSIKYYSNPEIGWEIAYKTNLGIELGLFKGKLNITTDLYKELRTNILQVRQDIPVTMGLWADQYVNLGKANGKGIDVSADYNHSINKDFWVTGRVNFTYAHSEYEYYEEPDYEAIGAPWRSLKGRTINQQEGYVAERLFIDQYDIDNSAKQQFGTPLPGDIKYMDVNGDGVIDELDRVAIGYPTSPEINYGFGVSSGYKGFDVSVFFSGSARQSFFLDYSKMSPFTRGSFNGKTTETGLAQFIVDDHWSEEHQDVYAAWPRLSTVVISNNAQSSSYWRRDIPYLRFKSFEIGYQLPDALSRKLLLSSLRFYLSGTNLLVFSDFKLWDVEQGSYGYGYPLQRTVNAGINVSF